MMMLLWNATCCVCAVTLAHFFFHSFFLFESYACHGNMYKVVLIARYLSVPLPPIHHTVISQKWMPMDIRPLPSKGLFYLILQHTKHTRAHPT